MKKKFILCLALGFCLGYGVVGQAAGKGAVNHVVLVWLNDPGNTEMRAEFIRHSKKLNSLPGIISRQVGAAMTSERSIVDDSFDVAVSVTLKDQAAFNAYMNAPLHKQIVEKKLKPLIKRVVAYDFISE
jgi:heme-degrading monooxygenase HmoA